MSIVQISRIQQRRGKKYAGTGLPQLASGELAWCVDSQELYIGNGSVAEGSPAVGNTKILTSSDLSAQSDLLNVFQHIYKVDDPTITTGIDANTPVSRTIQSVLDDSVNVTSFGAVGNGIIDDTIALQRAIDQLFLNTASPAYLHENNRVTLILPAGTYKITETIYIPSFATIIGAGADKTFISHSGSSAVFRFVNDMSTPGNPVGMGSTLLDSNSDGNFTNDPNDVQYTNQPRFITFSNLSIHTTSADQAVLQLEAVRDSIFENVSIQGNWNNVYNANSKGIDLRAFTSLVTCERNIFKNINIQGFSYAVYSLGDILNNIFDIGFVSNVRQGFVLGLGADAISIGQQYGPRDVKINNFKFYNVKQQAVYGDICSGIITNEVTLVNVGNDGGGVSSPIYPQIFFHYYGNTSTNTKSDRTSVLSSPSALAPYIPEISGEGKFEIINPNKVSLGNGSTYTELFRLPTAVGAAGGPSGGVTHNVNYVFKSVNNNYTRAGNMFITVDIDSVTSQLSDDYNCTGLSNTDDALRLDFKVLQRKN